MRIVSAGALEPGMLVAYMWRGQAEPRPVVGFVSGHRPTHGGAAGFLHHVHHGGGSGRWYECNEASCGEWLRHLRPQHEFIVLAEHIAGIPTVAEMQQQALVGAFAMVGLLAGGA